MKGKKKTPTFKDCRPASETASKIKARNRKSDSRCEVILRSRLWKRGFRFRKNVRSVPGCPDIVFSSSRLVVFCDGDFWHGRNWAARKSKLRKGSNSEYWIAKIERNRERDRENERKLRGLGWNVVRLWETDILKEPEEAADEVVRHLGRELNQ